MDLEGPSEEEEGITRLAVEGEGSGGRSSDGGTSIETRHCFMKQAGGVKIAKEEQKAVKICERPCMCKLRPQKPTLLCK